MSFSIYISNLKRNISKLKKIKTITIQNTMYILHFAVTSENIIKMIVIIYKCRCFIYEFCCYNVFRISSMRFVCCINFPRHKNTFYPHLSDNSDVRVPAYIVGQQFLFLITHTSTWIILSASSSSYSVFFVSWTRTTRHPHTTTFNASVDDQEFFVFVWSCAFYKRLPTTYCLVNLRFISKSSSIIQYKLTLGCQRAHTTFLF